MNMRNIRKLAAAAVMLGMMGGLAACGQEPPENVVVQDKDIDQMLKQAEKTEDAASTEEGADHGSPEKNYIESLLETDHYSGDFTDEKLHVHVKIDAEVDIPETDKMSVIRLSKLAITNDRMAEVRDALVGDVKLYDYVLSRDYTKRDIEGRLQTYNEDIKYWEDRLREGSVSEAEYDSEVSELQETISDWQERYDKAPVEIDPGEYPYSDTLQDVSKLYKENPENPYISWLYSLNPDGTVSAGISDYAESGEYAYFCVHNTSRYGNSIRYFRSPHCSLSSYGGILPSGIYMTYPAEYGEDYIATNACVDEIGIEPVKKEKIRLLEDETCTLSGEEAERIGDSLLERIGFDSVYGLDNGELSYQVIYDLNELDGKSAGYDTGSIVPIRKLWVLNYVRKIDGVRVKNYGGKYSDGYEGGEYVKHEWTEESITMLVNDSGIVGFVMGTPLQMEETLVEDSNMKSFNEISDIFEDMVPVKYAMEDMDAAFDGGTTEREIKVDRVELSYTRISEADDFDSGLFVPAWTFTGSIDDGYGYVDQDVAILTINAIDGTVIDTTVGY